MSMLDRTELDAVGSMATLEEAQMCLSTIGSMKRNKLTHDTTDLVISSYHVGYIFGTS